MQPGIGSWTYGWAAGVKGYPKPATPLTPLHLLERANAFGVEVVQIADNMPLKLLSGAELDELSRVASAANITLEIGTVGVQPRNLLQHLEIADRLGARLIRSLIADVGSRPEVAQATRWIAEALPQYEAAGVCLALENYEQYTARELGDLIRGIGSPALGVCLDTVNSLGALETPDMLIAELGPWVRSLHVKDFAIERAPSRMGFQVVGRPAGQGMLNVPRLVSQLQAANVAPNLILELWTPDQGSVEASIRLEEEWAAESVRFLKRFCPAGCVAGAESIADA
ncbi:MAG TPA: sugar phosphate isomerase/epimerase [Bryobacteraceae bacterium]|nr:sugar phosphate isomerase/epimerase [Bryobacteraceae bacterium]